MINCVFFIYIAFCNLNHLHRNLPNTHTICTLHPVIQSLESGREGDRTPTAAWEISNSIAFSSVSVDWLTCSPSPRPLWMQSIDPQDGEEMKGGEPVLRKSKHRSRWQNTDHPGDLDLPCFLYRFTWPLASKPKAVISLIVFTHCIALRADIPACEHHSTF